MSAGGESRGVLGGVCCCLALVDGASMTLRAGAGSCRRELLVGRETCLLPLSFFSPSAFSGGWEQFGRGTELAPVSSFPHLSVRAGILFSRESR